MKLDTTKTLNTRSGEPFVRPVAGTDGEPLTIGWACVEALDLPPASGAALSKEEKLKRDKLAGRIYDAMTGQTKTLDLAAADQVLLTTVLDQFLASPRALAEAIRLIDPAGYERATKAA